MSKIFENKYLIHIASEIIIIIGIAFYFNKENKKLKSNIDDLSQRIKEQDELLKNHSQLIKKLMESTNRIQMTHNDDISNITSTDKKLKQNEIHKYSIKHHHTKSPLSPPVKSVKKGNNTPQVSFMNKHTEKLSVIEENSDSDSDSDSDLDAEIAEEIEELNNSESDSDISLKKEQQ